MSFSNSVDPDFGRLLGKIKFYNQKYCEGRGFKISCRQGDGIYPYMLSYRGMPFDGDTCGGLIDTLDFMDSHDFVGMLDMIDKHVGDFK